MSQHAPIQQPHSPVKTVLDERASKALIAAYGIPVVGDISVPDASAAVEAAESLGYPVVVKGIGKGVAHKTEAGAVHLNLGSRGQVHAAVDAIRRALGDRLEGFLVQPHVDGRRELVLGMSRDPDFGPVIMVGWGGIFTEVLKDTAFRLAPISAIDAEAMLDEIKAVGMLGAFRGEAAADRAMLTRILSTVSRLALDRPDIGEIDINPLLIQKDGNPVAVDALIVMQPSRSARKEIPLPVPAKAITQLFHPRSVAFIGASEQFGKWGHMLVTNTIGGGFRGRIHLVNPKGGTLYGRPFYRSLEEIPESVDLAVITIPAAAVMGLLPALKRKGVHRVVLISSGFRETGPEGLTLEKALVRQARKDDICLLGPNTMGICNPHINFYCTGSPVFPHPGSTAMVAQSGNMGTQLLAFAEAQGIGIRGFAGSGNEAMLTISDYLDGFEEDDLTKTIVLYMENVDDGRRFFDTAKRVGKRKPIVLLKGGQTMEGNRAASSHTGAMAANADVFNGMCRQAGIIKVDLPMELLDLSAAFSALPLPRGRRIGIMTLGGGWGVVTADLCARYGLSVPELSEPIIRRLDEQLPPYWSRSNPVDLVGERDLGLPLSALECLLAWEGCDAVIHLGILGRRHFVTRLADTAETADPGGSCESCALARQALADFEAHYIKEIARLMAHYQKPVVGVRLLTASSDRTVYPLDDGPYAAVFYETPERAVRAIAGMADYHRFLRLPEK